MTDFAQSIVVLASLYLGTPTVPPPESPPPSQQSMEIKALVLSAAQLIDKRGKKAFPEFRKKDTQWYHDDTYVFVYDLKGDILVNPAFPEREGKNLLNQTDVDGKPFHKEFIRLAEQVGSGWVSYMFLRPGTHSLVKKWTFVKRVSFEGTSGLVAAGFYTQ